MKAEIKDTTKEIELGLRAAGLNVDQFSTELILNVVDLVRESKKDVTLKDIVHVRVLVEKLFENQQ